jgi:hypothetical protein
MGAIKYNLLKVRVRHHLNDPAFDQPISKLEKNYQPKGTITCITKFSKLPK